MYTTIKHYDIFCTVHVHGKDGSHTSELIRRPTYDIRKVQRVDRILKRGWITSLQHTAAHLLLSITTL